MTHSEDLAPGAVVGGRYRIEALLGEGGMGRVFRATQIDLGRGVALKVLLPSLVAQDEALRRFQREAALAQRLDHPNTVRILDVGRTGVGTPFIAFELLRGRPLDDLLRAGALPPARAARIVSQVLKSLMDAHAQGVVHRDIKPSNIFVSDFQGEADFVKVLDFGIAKAFAVEDEAAAAEKLTRAGHAVGTPSYMAPEQVLGKQVTTATDLYALGLVLAEMLSGKVVVQRGSTIETCMAQVSPEPVPLPPEVMQSPLGAVIHRATQKPVERRYGSAAEMLQQIEEVMGAGRASSVPGSGPRISDLQTGYVPTGQAQGYPAAPQGYPAAPQGYPAAPQGYPAAPPGAQAISGQVPLAGQSSGQIPIPGHAAAPIGPVSQWTGVSTPQSWPGGAAPPPGMTGPPPGAPGMGSPPKKKGSGGVVIAVIAGGVLLLGALLLVMTLALPTSGTTGPVTTDAAIGTSTAQAHLPAGCDVVVRVDVARTLSQPSFQRRVMPALASLQAGSGGGADAEAARAFLREARLDPTRDITEVGLCLKGLDGPEEGIKLAFVLGGRMRLNAVVPALAKTEKAGEILSFGGRQFMKVPAEGGGDPTLFGQMADGAIVVSNEMNLFMSSFKDEREGASYGLPPDADASFAVSGAFLAKASAQQKSSMPGLGDVQQITGHLTLEDPRAQIRIITGSDGAASVFAGTARQMLAGMRREAARQTSQVGEVEALSAATVRVEGPVVLVESKWSLDGIDRAAQLLSDAIHAATESADPGGAKPATGGSKPASGRRKRAPAGAPSDLEFPF